MHPLWIVLLIIIGAALAMFLIAARVEGSLFATGLTPQRRRLTFRDKMRKYHISRSSEYRYTEGWWGTYTSGESSLETYVWCIVWWRIPVWLFAITKGRSVQRRWALEHITGVSK